MYEFPQIKIQLKGIEQTMICAFNGQCDQYKELFEAAIKDALDPVAIKLLARNKAQEIIKTCVNDAVRSWFYATDSGVELIKTHIHQELTTLSNLYKPDA